MTVIYYAKGEHASGYVGYRAVTTLGDGEYKQAYFSSKAKATKKNNEWREKAEETKKARKLQEKKAENYIALNFRAVIRSQREKLSNGYTTYVSPAFVVGAGKQKHFPIGRKYTFDEAFTLAVNAYCTMYDFDDKAKQELLSRKPEKELFTGYLYKESIANGVKVDLVDLCERLDKQKEGPQQ